MIFLVVSEGQVQYLPGQDSDADDSIVQSCGYKAYLTTQFVCCDNVLTSLRSLESNGGDDLKCCGSQAFNGEKSFCASCGKTKTVLPLSEKALWSCCKHKHMYRSDNSKCCDCGVEEGNQCAYRTHRQPRSQGFSSFRPLERQRRDLGNEVHPHEPLQRSFTSILNTKD